MTGRLVVVSGGGTGIGRGIAATFANGGDHVVIIGWRPEVLDKARADIGVDLVTAVPADLAAPAQVTAAAARIGAIGVLVNNAGANVSGPADDSLAALAESWRHGHPI
jgi:3-oxoacyl-[acyl-carrier protein] reductase